jgi:hypothetical protein
MNVNNTSPAPRSLSSNPPARIARAGILLQRATEDLHNLKMETANRTPTKWEALHLDTLEQSIASQKRFLELVLATVKNQVAA